MNLAVIIPAYNVANFIERCLASCMIQPEVSEIIVIDDGSTDGTLQIVKSCQKKDQRIHILHHEHHQNKGRSASRNLGIRNCRSKWITFCDADDYYKNHRFRQFESRPLEGDGSYELVTSVYTSEELKQNKELTTGIADEVSPDHLFNYLIAQREESISLISLIIKKQAVANIGLFDEQLTIGEDSDLIWRLAYKYKLYNRAQSPPLIIRQVHQNNTYSDVTFLEKGRLKFYSKWDALLPQYKMSRAAIIRIKSSLLYYQFRCESREKKGMGSVLSKLKYRLQCVKLRMALDIKTPTTIDSTPKKSERNI